MTCSRCPEVALYIAGGKGFCRDHRAEAVARTVSIGQETQSRIRADGRYQEIVSLYGASVTRPRF